MVLGLAPEPSKWVSVYFPVSWLTQVHTTIKVLDTIVVRFCLIVVLTSLAMV